MVVLENLRHTPITKIHCKNHDVMLDIDQKIGHLRALTSVDFRFKSSSLFPNACSRGEIHGTQRSNTASYCTAYVPFGSARQTVGEGREKVRLTFQGFASPIVQLFCSLFVVTTFFRTNFRFPSPTVGVREVLFRECICAH
jgi:hypothetical protein